MSAATFAKSCLAADALLQGKLIRTLEVSQRAGAIIPELPNKQASWDQIWATGSFHATVMPDLPSVATLADLLPKVARRRHTLALEDPEATETPAEAFSGFFRIRTVAAQLKTPKRVSRQLQETAAQVSDAGEAEGALLLVSGGHPVRQIPLVRNLLPVNAGAMLKEGHRLRETGLLPKGVQLWATENPLVNSVDSLARKLDAGAEAIITQPPLLPDAFDKWWSEADKRGLVAAGRLIVGLPFLSSLRNLDFWLMLTHASGSSEADAVRQKWADHERRAGGNPEKQLDFRLQQTRECLRRIESLPGVRGVHLMPVTKRGWKDLLTLIADGDFGT